MPGPNLFQFAVLGDLHWSEAEQRSFEEAREQILQEGAQAVIALGDIGMYGICGTRYSFIGGRQYLESYDVPYYCLIGNHDMECTSEFDTDEESVQAFCDSFEYKKPYMAFELGPMLGITLSSTKFRENEAFPHEVYIDQEQFDWFEYILENNKNRETVVFSHCPPLGSHLKVIQNLHLRNGNAWLNQSHNPLQFIQLLEKHPQVKLWFSGHNHLGQSHIGSVSKSGSCTFVHTGVIGRVSRDQCRQSRLVTWNEGEITVSTVDHLARNKQIDFVVGSAASDLERQVNLLEESDVYCAPPKLESGEPFAEFEKSILVQKGETIIEYDKYTRDAVGVVSDSDFGPKVIFENGQLYAQGRWWGKKVLTTNSDGYYFKLPHHKR